MDAKPRPALHPGPRAGDAPLALLRSAIMRPGVALAIGDWPMPACDGYDPREPPTTEPTTDLGGFLVGETGGADQDQGFALLGGQHVERLAQFIHFKMACLTRQ